MKKLIGILLLMLVLTVGCKSECGKAVEEKEAAPVDTPAEVLQ
tara:strand:- start:494 stop:622 length:129 start_codon:yes stop_codon:yes gene_type:complete